MGVPSVSVRLAVEGPVDEVILRRILNLVGIRCGSVYGKRGKTHLESHLDGYNRAARWTPWIVVIDLDQSASCAPLYVRARLANPSSLMCFRVAVRSVESWLLADAERLAVFLSVSRARVPRLPDTLDHPKRALVDLARQSRRTAIREDMIPGPRSHRQVGPGYTARIIEFVSGSGSRWRPDVAAERSDSLRRCIRSLQTLAPTMIVSRDLPPPPTASPGT